MLRCEAGGSRPADDLLPEVSQVAGMGGTSEAFETRTLSIFTGKERSVTCTL